MEIWSNRAHSKVRMSSVIKVYVSILLELIICPRSCKILYELCNVEYTIYYLDYHCELH
jgi:hypothetical protein